jgi:hypothetical protein
VLIYLTVGTKISNAQVVLKLNEVRFKPFFLKLVDWAGAREDAAATAAEGTHPSLLLANATS